MVIDGMNIQLLIFINKITAYHIQKNAPSVWTVHMCIWFASAKRNRFFWGKIGFHCPCNSCAVSHDENLQEIIHAVFLPCL